MTSEMDLLRMDERQRLAWLLANRGTVIAVGTTWLGMIVWELARGRSPLFLIAMVPVFALIRVGLFFYYCASPLDLGGRPVPAKLPRYVKSASAALLAVALFLPLYSVPLGAFSSAGRRYDHAWGLIADDPLWILPLALAFLWPLPLLLWLRRYPHRRSTVVVHLAQPLLAAISALVILWIPQFMFEFRLVVIWLLPVTVRPELGCYLAIGADGLYVIGWLAELLVSPGLREGSTSPAAKR